jgi:hypothetical protein
MENAEKYMNEAKNSIRNRFFLNQFSLFKKIGGGFREYYAVCLSFCVSVFVYPSVNPS